ncbi:Carbohydrate sulfotransferase 11 [Desmophyllum pertusum]|uniref:Carbohydrate sulfotransferase n=1 Tax=Desmophyllum pertusum TaxID=174260 RepID=A0A9X0CL15_9CNID|nr:Carbohydrate sulfotransferase 11 [Desmophyllum pertusum]
MGFVIVGTFVMIFVPEHDLLHESKANDKVFERFEFRPLQESVHSFTKRLQERISTACKKRAGGVAETTLLSKITRHHVLVSNRYKTLFCYVPKVACTNWKRVFHVLEGHFNTTAEINGTLAQAHKSLDTLEEYSDDEINHMLQTYKKIVFIREPMMRVLSAYRDKFVYGEVEFHQTFGKNIIKKFRKNFTGRKLMKITLHLMNLSNT